MSAEAKRAAVIRLIQGADPTLVAREVGQSRRVVASWRRRFLQFGLSGLEAENYDDCERLSELVVARRRARTHARRPRASAEVVGTHRRRPRGKIVGILGGLGPFAHIDFERKLLEAAQSTRGATRDQEFPEWVLCSSPQTPDRTQAYLGLAEDPVPFLAASVERLERAGAEFVVITCNTAHLFLDELAERTSSRFLSLIEATAARAAALAPGGTVGVLATTGTLKSRLYHDALEGAGLRTVSPLDLAGGEVLQLRRVMEPIYGPVSGGSHQGGGIKTHGSSESARLSLLQAATRLVHEGQADILVLGCTEIPLVLDGAEHLGRPLLDPARALAEAVLVAVYADETQTRVSEFPSEMAPA